MRYTDRYSGTKIGHVLTEQGRRQDWLAKRVDVSPAAINRWIRGRRRIDLATAKRIAEALDVDIFLIIDVPEGTEEEPEDSAA